jgi:hypothetical protein
MREARETGAGTPDVGGRPNPAEPALLTSPVARALPRPLGVAAGAAMLMHGDTGVLALVGFGLLLSSVPRHPAAWWRYVRTGLVAQPSTDWKYLQEGTWRVDVVAAEEATFEVVRAVREVTGLGVNAAVELVEQGGRVADGLSAGSAARVCARLERAGATVTPVSTAGSFDRGEPHP